MAERTFCYELGSLSNATSSAENDANGSGWLASGGLDRTVKVRPERLH